VPARIQTVNVAVDHVGYPGNRMPVALMACGKGPDDIVDGQTIYYPGVFIDVPAVVEINKLMAADLVIYGKGENGQKQADPDFGTDMMERIRRSHLENPNYPSMIMAPPEVRFTLEIPGCFCSMSSIIADCWATTFLRCWLSFMAALC